MNMKKIKRMSRIAALLCLGLLMAQGSVSQAAAPEQKDEKLKRTAVMEQRVANAEARYQQLFGSAVSPLEETDPNFAQTMQRFIYGEVEQQGSLTDQERLLITLVALTTNGNQSLLTMNVNGALNIGVTPAEIKEALYQATPYIGFPKTVDALKLVNEILQERSIELPLADQSTVDEATRFSKGLAVQKEIFGSLIDKAYENAPVDQLHIQYDLSGFCFGDTYTRKVLDLKGRELLTMVAIAALGGCEPQLKAHIAANLTVGNSKKKIIAALSECIPYIGFPRSLNAIACANEVFATLK